MVEITGEQGEIALIQTPSCHLASPPTTFSVTSDNTGLNEALIAIWW